MIKKFSIKILTRFRDIKTTETSKRYGKEKNTQEPSGMYCILTEARKQVMHVGTCDTGIFFSFSLNFYRNFLLLVQ